ncbi:MAG: Bacteriophage lambda head decoration protein D [Rhodobacteraceae bacterium HLUCCA12]|nr:MAG: Bacteriophage lambda head decoration protein D [Rhodobacteraceae bacterium HLUCCA12]
MAPLVKAPTEGDLLKLDLDKNYTREAVTLLAGTDYEIGSVLGQFTSGDNDGKYALSPNAAGEPDTGEQVAAGVLIQAVDASDGDATGIIIKRGPAIVARDMLVYDDSVDDSTKVEAKLAQLTTLGIVARENV